METTPLSTAEKEANILQAFEDLKRLSAGEICEQKVTVILASYFPEVPWNEKVQIQGAGKGKHRTVVEGRSISDGIVQLLLTERVASVPSIIRSKVMETSASVLQSTSASEYYTGYSNRTGTGIDGGSEER